MPSLRSRMVVETVEEDEELSFEQEGKAESAGLRQIFLVGCGVIAVGVLVAVAWANINRTDEEPVQPEKSPATLASEARKEYDSGKREVMAAVSAFVEAETMDAKLKWVQRTEGIEQRMGDYYGRHPAKAQQIYDFPLILLTQRPEGNYYTVNALTVDNERMNFAVPVTSIGPRIAWESHVGYCEVDWDQFIGRRTPRSVEMRVYVQPATHYVAPFEDKEEYLSVEITRPKSSKKAFGYVSKATTENIAEMRDLMLSGRPEPVVLKMHYPEPTRPLVLVDEFVAAKWFSIEGFRD